MKIHNKGTNKFTSKPEIKKFKHATQKEIPKLATVTYPDVSLKNI